MAPQAAPAPSLAESLRLQLEPAKAWQARVSPLPGPGNGHVSQASRRPGSQPASRFTLFRLGELRVAVAAGGPPARSHRRSRSAIIMSHHDRVMIVTTDSARAGRRRPESSPLTLPAGPCGLRVCESVPHRRPPGSAAGSTRARPRPRRSLAAGPGPQVGPTGRRRRPAGD